MAAHSEDEDFRGRNRRSRVLGYDADAWIKASSESRKEYRDIEGHDKDGLDVLARDPRMDAIQKQHQLRQAEHDKADQAKSDASHQRERSERILVQANEISALEKELHQGNEQQQQTEAQQGRSM
jgi:hypothetical protein